MPAFGQAGMSGKGGGIMYDNLCKKIVKLMNLNRCLSKQEQRFVVEWKERLDMKDEIILEAVKRAVNYKKTRASFPYINAVLENWAEKKVGSFTDIMKLDDEYRKKKEGKSSSENKNDAILAGTGVGKNYHSVQLNIAVERIRDTAKLPTRGSEYAAGYDLYADIDKEIDIEPHEVVKIRTGLKIAVPEGYFGAIFARSGLATKEQLAPANCVGVCDSDYRGEYIIALQNNGNVKRTVKPGERIAQLVIMPFLQVGFVEGKLDGTVRGEGGFGSTGK